MRADTADAPELNDRGKGASFTYDAFLSYNQKDGPGNSVNGALRTVEDVVEMISRKLRACTISEAARRPRQAQASTA